MSRVMSRVLNEGGQSCWLLKLSPSGELPPPIILRLKLSPF